MSSLQAQKKLLAAESELNRAALLEECKNFSGHAAALKHELVSSASLMGLFSGAVGGWRVVRKIFPLFSRQQHQDDGAQPKKSRWISLINSVLVGSKLFRKF